MRLAVKVIPKASSERIVGISADANGAFWLKVAVTAAPEDGKANARLVALLAKSMKIAKRDISLIQGAAQRNKALLIKGASADDLERWLNQIRSKEE